MNLRNGRHKGSALTYDGEGAQYANEITPKGTKWTPIGALHYTHVYFPESALEARAICSPPSGSCRMRSFLGMGSPLIFQCNWGLGLPTAMHGNLTSCFATAMKTSSKEAILAGILLVGESVTLVDGAPSPILVWAVTQNS